ncbi:MAG: hypothetical protein AAF327_09790 [Cyanobacteria bacterium P01_A01_bin.37]
MNTLVHQSDLSSDLLGLGQTLQSFFDDCPIRVECAVRDERLIVLGQHPAYAGLNPAYILKILERKIQSFQLDFTQHVRLYLRIAGQAQPYAHRWFMIQPPPPPLPICLTHHQSSSSSEQDEDEHWVVEDDELDVLVHQLTSAHPLDDSAAIAVPVSAHRQPHSASTALQTPSTSDEQPYSTTPATALLSTLSIADPSEQAESSSSESLDDRSGELALPDLRKIARSSEQSKTTSGRSLQLQARDQIRLLSRTVLNQLSVRNTAVLTPRHIENIDGRIAALTGAALLGIAGTTYGMTRPCVVGECSALSTAHELGSASSEIIQTAESWPDIEIARDKLAQAIELIAPIPIWSQHSDSADEMIVAYQEQIMAIETLLDMEKLANTAHQIGQADTTATISELENIRALFQEVITTFEAVPATSELYPITVQHLATYREQATQLLQRIEGEQTAMQSLEKAKQAAELAQLRQRVAQSLENWQFARVTWIVAVERLDSVPQATAAGAEALSLMNSYQDALDAVNHRVQREQTAVRILDQAEQRAQVAKAAEQRFDWQQAVQDWDQAIAYAQQIDNRTNYQIEAEELVESYTNSLDSAKEKLNLSERVETELEKTCIGEIRLCNLLSVGQSISVRLDDDYIAAIDAARSSGNEQLQAVVTDHQLTLRRTLEQIAHDYRLSVEVYDTQNQLLERHDPPQQNTST